MEVGYQRIPSNPLVVHHVLRAAGVTDFVALGLAGEATLFAWPLTRPNSTGVVVVTEIHCQLHNRSHQVFREYDQPSVQPTKIKTGQLLDSFMLHRIETRC